MHCGLLASAASTLSTGAFDAPGSASKFSRLLPTCPCARHTVNPRRHALGCSIGGGGGRHLRIVQLGLGAVRLHRRCGTASELDLRLEARLWVHRARRLLGAGWLGTGGRRTLPPALPAPAPARPRFEMSPSAARARVETAGPAGCMTSWFEFARSNSCGFQLGETALNPSKSLYNLRKDGCRMSEATLPCFAPLGVLAPVWHEEVLFVTGLQNVIERRPWTTPDCP